MEALLTPPPRGTRMNCFGGLPFSNRRTKRGSRALYEGFRGILGGLNLRGRVKIWALHQALANPPSQIV